MIRIVMRQAVEFRAIWHHSFSDVCNSLLYDGLSSGADSLVAFRSARAATAETRGGTYTQRGVTPVRFLANTVSPTSLSRNRQRMCSARAGRRRVVPPVEQFEDRTRLSVTAVSSVTANGTYDAGAIIDITVSVDELCHPTTTVLTRYCDKPHRPSSAAARSS
jgi:hypothetical protein